MKIVFDTNVLISGFITPTGPSHYVFTASLKRHLVILSPFILKEFERNLLEKIEVPPGIVERALDFLRKRCLVLEVVDNPALASPDKKDRSILNLVDTAKPHYFVTDDKALLALKKMGPTLFLSPREAIAVLGSAG